MRAITVTSQWQHGDLEHNYPRSGRRKKLDRPQMFLPPGARQDDLFLTLTEPDFIRL